MYNCDFLLVFDLNLTDKEFDILGLLKVKPDGAVEHVKFLLVPDTHAFCLRLAVRST